MKSPRHAADTGALTRLSRLAVGVAVILALYFAREVLVPVAVATLLSFVLAPVVRQAERWIGRVPAVIVVVALAFSALTGVGWVLTRQLVDVGTKIPDYRENILAKVRALRLPGGPAFSRLEQMFGELKQELPGPSQPSPAQGKTGPAPAATPLPVQIIPATTPGAADLARKTALFLLGPLGQIALVALLLMFILVEREDLRARLVRLAGTSRMGPATLAMDDAARRLGHYLGFQLLVNIGYGTLIAGGLYLIGIPNSVLWGGLAGVMRFLPYVGPWLGASAPLLLSLAISPSWWTPLLTLGLFATLELINSNAIEPWLYGSATGVTPLAIVAGAIFWTWIWGPVGLLLAVPLTVCLAVLGRHVPGMEFLGILLSDEPVLSPREECYQRLLGFDPDAAGAVAQSYLENHPLSALYDDVLLPALTLAELDLRRGAVTREQHAAVHTGIRDLLEDLRASMPVGEAEPRPLTRPPVCIVAAASERDELAAMMLAQLLNHEGFGAVAVPASVTGEALFRVLSEYPAVWISATAPASALRVRRMVRSFRERFPALWLGAGFWGTEKTSENRLAEAGAAGGAFSLARAVELSQPLLHPPSPPHQKN